MAARGGGRGRGRGRGGGGGNAARDQFNAAFAGMSKEDSRAVFESFSKPVKGSGMLYPPLEKAAEMPGPTEFELRVVEHTKRIAHDLENGPEVNGRREGAPWRLARERKVVGVEIESYSDRYRRPNPTTGPAGTTSLSAPALRLSRSLFPPALWAEYFDGAAAAPKRGEGAKKRRRVLDGDDEDGDEDKEDDEDEDEGDFDFDDEEEEDHQDYDHNYFDNGEGDDDSGGEGGDDEGGRYDD